MVGVLRINSRSEVTILKKRAIPIDQIIFAIPAMFFILTPLIDLFINYYRVLTKSSNWEAYMVTSYLPIVIAGLLVVALVVRLVAFKDRNLFKKMLQRTYTFQTTLILFVLYMGLVFMSIGVNGFTSYAVNGHPYTKMSMWTYIANVLLFLFFSSLVYDERVKGFLVKACCIIATLYAMYGLIEYIVQPYSGTLRITFYNSNHYGYYLAVSISLTAAMVVEKLSGKRRADEGESASAWAVEAVAWCFMLVIQCVALSYNDTLGVWVAVLFSHILLFIVYRIKDGRFNFRVFVPFALFLITSVVCAFFTRNIFTSLIRTFSDAGNILRGVRDADEAGNGRWQTWRLTIKHIIERPIFGNGIEGLLEIITLEGSRTGSPHNEYLEYMAFFGVPAGVCYIAACVSVYLHGLKYRKELNPMTLVCMIGGFGYLVSAFFGVCFYYTVTYPFIFLGLSLNFTAKDRPAMDEPEPEPEPEPEHAPESEPEHAAEPGPEPEPTPDQAAPSLPGDETQS